MPIPIYNVINVNLTSITTTEPEVVVPCGTCNRCCQELTPFLTVEEIQSGLYPLSLFAPSVEQLSVNPELGPMVAMFKNPKTKGCSLFVNNACTIYEYRPKACKQFDCRAGHHPRIPDMTVKS